MRHPFSNRLLAHAHSEPSATQSAACVALQLWALLPSAQAEANAVRDEQLALHLSLLESALTLPEEENDPDVGFSSPQDGGHGKTLMADPGDFRISGGSAEFLKRD